jgi:hypothetical protein
MKLFIAFLQPWMKRTLLIWELWVPAKRKISIPFLFILVVASQVNAQEPSDALRYSWVVPNGTARQQAIGGAMGSLGGDISSAYVNPAGLGFYKTGDFVVTPGYNFSNNKSTFLNRTETEKKNSFNLGTSGVVLGAGGRRGSKVSSSAFVIAVNRSANLNNSILYRGQNTSTSYSQKFLEEIRNANEGDANNVAGNYPYGSSLAFNTYWIDTIGGGSNGNFEFQSRATPLLATGLLQENTLYTTGGITELAFGGGASFNDKIYVGGTLGIPFLRYDRLSTFTEVDATDNPMNQFNFATIEENLTTSGIGVNLKAGVIFKPVEFVRLGLAVHSPSFYNITESYNVYVETDTENYEGLMNQNSESLTGNVSDFKYYLMTPYRVIGSASYVLRETQDVRQQKGFITADIEYINYKASSFSTDAEADNSQATKDYFTALNDVIDDTYKAAFNFKLGGELKFNTVMVRAGAAYYGNPYKNLIGEKGNRFLLSGGLGYRHKGMFIDLTYVHNMTKDVHVPYRLQSAPNVMANIRNTTGNAVLTFGFKI